MKQETQEWLVEQRSENLAIVLLTERDDLTIERRPSDVSTDFLVGIKKGSRRTGRMIGVEIQGSLDSPRRGRQHDDFILRFPAGKFSRFHDAPFPICLFYFNVRTDEAFFGWIVEPVTDSATAALRFQSTPRLQPLNEAALDEIIRRVHAWYDARKTAAVKA